MLEVAFDADVSATGPRKLAVLLSLVSEAAQS
jgi:hypothetical protein